MNKRIKELAEQAAGGLLSYHAEGDWYLSENEVEKFAKLVRADEREACAKLCEEWGAWNNTAQDCAEAIRKRGDVK